MIGFVQKLVSDKNQYKVGNTCLPADSSQGGFYRVHCNLKEILQDYSS